MHQALRPEHRPVTRETALDAVATTLLARTSRLSRLLLRTGSRELSRTEVGLLTTLADGRRSIGELGESEALAQPSVSKLVDRLQAQGLVVRERDPQDRRVVQVAITADGEARMRTVRGHIQAALREALVDLPDDDLATLVEAGDVLERVIDTLRSEAPRPIAARR